MFKFGVNANKLAHIDGRLVDTCSAYRDKGCNPETAAVLMFITLVDALNDASGETSEVREYTNWNSVESFAAITEWLQVGLIPNQLASVAFAAIEKIPLLGTLTASNYNHENGLEVEPNKQALDWLKEELSSTLSLLEEIKLLDSHDLKIRILSALYYVADEKVGMMAGTPYRLTSLSYTFGSSDTILGDELRMQVVPLMAHAGAEIYRLLLVESVGPEASAAIPTLDRFMHDLFVQHRVKLIVGSKRAFWGGIEPDCREFPVPVVKHIDRVVQAAEELVVLKQIFGTE